jgi:hypothetical protein
MWNCYARDLGWGAAFGKQILGVSRKMPTPRICRLMALKLKTRAIQFFIPQKNN